MSRQTITGFDTASSRIWCGLDAIWLLWMFKNMASKMYAYSIVSYWYFNMEFICFKKKKLDPVVCLLHISKLSEGLFDDIRPRPPAAIVKFIFFMHVVLASGP